MRLSPKELAAITKAFSAVLADIAYQLYLFGSRADDLKKGGDIDLLVIVTADRKSAVVERKIQLREAIFQRIPEQRIDITVASNSETQTDTFLLSILPAALLLDEQLPSKQ